MTTPSVPRCGRMDPHEPHAYNIAPRVIYGTLVAPQALTCPGVVIHEGGAQCQHCGHVVCTCDAELAEARRVEWESPECCASGRCEVCTPGYVWGRDG